MELKNQRPFTFDRRSTARQRQLADHWRLWSNHGGHAQRRHDDEPVRVSATRCVGAEVWYCGLPLASQFAVPELSPCDSGQVPYLRIERLHRPPIQPSDWQHTWSNEHGVVLAVARIGDRFVLRFDDGGLFTVDADARTVACHEADDLTTRHQLLDQVLPQRARTPGPHDDPREHGSHAAWCAHVRCRHRCRQVHSRCELPDHPGRTAGR